MERWRRRNAVCKGVREVKKSVIKGVWIEKREGEAKECEKEE